MQVWNVLHRARCKYRTQKVVKNRHLGTIAELCRAISSQLTHVSTIEKKLVKQQYIHMFPQYGELRPTSGWDRSGSLGNPCKFQRVSHLRGFAERHSSIGRQPNFAALDRGRHLYSAGRPSRWALAHIVVSVIFSLHLICLLLWRYYKLDPYNSTVVMMGVGRRAVTNPAVSARCGKLAALMSTVWRSLAGLLFQVTR